LAIDGLAGRASTPNGWKYAATSGVLWNDWLMGRYVINASARSNAPTQAIWDVVADVATWQNWGPYSKTYLESEGTPTPDGVGAIRAYAVGPVTSREQVTIYEPPHRLGYHILSGFPVKDYNALVTLEPVEGDQDRRALARRVRRKAARHRVVHANRDGALFELSRPQNGKGRLA
jgi:hypothetical protein